MLCGLMATEHLGGVLLQTVDGQDVEAHCDRPPGGCLRSALSHTRVAALQQLVQINLRIQPNLSNGTCFGREAAQVLKMQRGYTSPACICAVQPVLCGTD